MVTDRLHNMGLLGINVVVSCCLLIHPELWSNMNNYVQQLVAGCFLLEKGSFSMFELVACLPNK